MAGNARPSHVASPTPETPTKGICNHLGNVVATSALFRAVLDALDAWVSEGFEPPPSAVPTVADGTLVSVEEWAKQFPAVPSALRPYGPSELSLVDRSVNETAGVHAPMVTAPLGTYTGWNTRAPGQVHGALNEFTGSTLPFAARIRAAAEDLVARRRLLDEDVERAVTAAADCSVPATASTCPSCTPERGW
ncbi:alpha/beta hydrolase domain-containing protein [Streptomyces sp. NPDC050619]|uniref:alpha/beta hydrolase domain-containing protein n=1 Tax=Streptomyces sp. NPDC050619 TaxID=3157214 RepID=UPI00343F214E